MISSISPASTAAISSAHTPPQAPAPTVPPKKEDSVHLSPQAQAAAKGDLDHDGDSH